MEPTVLSQVDAHIATITLQRPDRLNAFDLAMIELLTETVEAAATDPEVRVVIVTGAGRGFCAGGDVKAMADAAAAPPAADEPAAGEQAALIRRLERVTELLHEMPKVTIAAVNGPCAGAGFSMACAADLRYAAESAVFTTAFVHAGQTGDYGGTWLLPRLVGAGRARELYLLGDRVGAEDAARMGLVNAVVPDGELLAHTRAVAARLAAAPPLALAAIKANLNDAESLGLGALLDAEAERMAANNRTRDAKEAVLARAEGRPPVYEGR